MKDRLRQEETIDDPALPAEVWNHVHRDLDRMHRWLGNYRAVFGRLERAQANSVIDLGCGNGALLRRLVHHRKTVRGIGVDLRPPVGDEVGIAFLEADATRDALPEADAAVSLCLMHHLTEDQVMRMIRNSRRSVRRLILLDLVRDRVPLWLFRKFVAPLVHPVTATDGITSIQRAWTPGELRELVSAAVAGTSACWQHAVAPLGIRQVVEIAWHEESRAPRPALR